MKGDDSIPLLLQNNAQAGIIVCEFVSWLDTKRGQGDKDAEKLFFAPPLGQTKKNDKGVCLVDWSVYSRNRCFRLLGQSQFDKPTTLTVVDPESATPAAQLLLSLASWKRAGISYFVHSLVPLDSEHVVTCLIMEALFRT